MARKVKKMSNKRYFDYSLLFVIIFIVGFGLVMIYSTSSYTAQMEYGSSEYYFKALEKFKETKIPTYIAIAYSDIATISYYNENYKQ